MQYLKLLATPLTYAVNGVDINFILPLYLWNWLNLTSFIAHIALPCMKPALIMNALPLQLQYSKHVKHCAGYIGLAEKSRYNTDFKKPETHVGYSTVHYSTITVSDLFCHAWWHSSLHLLCL